MSDSMSLDFPNAAEWFAELFALPKAVRERVAKGTVATGCSVIRKEAVLRAPLYTGQVAQGHPPPGTLKRSIYQTRLPEECTETLEVWKVDVRRGRSAVAARGKNKGQRVLEKDAFYAMWVEYGHYTRTPGTTSREHRRLRSGVDLYTGSTWVPARPYMRPAFESKKGEAMEAMQRYLTERLPEATAAFRYFKAIGGVVPAPATA